MDLPTFLTLVNSKYLFIKTEASFQEVILTFLTIVRHFELGSSIGQFCRKIARACVCSGRGTNSPELRVVSKNPRVI